MVNDYESFKKEIFRITSIDLNLYKERQMKRRIDSLIAKKDINGYVAYVDLLKKDTLAFEEFVSYLTINVSEFFRNVEQWDHLEKIILPNLFDKFGKRIKIWSAACSTGEEPYSLAMLLSKFVPLNQIDIYATDIDKIVLARAKEGKYIKKNLAGVSDANLKKFFDEVEPNVFQVKDELKKCIKFDKHNLLLDNYRQDFHLICCRNVMIYFTEEAKDDIYKKFYNSLKKDGILFVGSTEQIMQASEIGFETVKSFFYKKA